MEYEWIHLKEGIQNCYPEALTRINMLAPPESFYNAPPRMHYGCDFDSFEYISPAEFKKMDITDPRKIFLINGTYRRIDDGSVHPTG